MLFILKIEYVLVTLKGFSSPIGDFVIYTVCKLDWYNLGLSFSSPIGDFVIYTMKMSAKSLETSFRPLSGILLFIHLLGLDVQEMQANGFRPLSGILLFIRDTAF